MSESYQSLDGLCDCRDILAFAARDADRCQPKGQCVWGEICTSTLKIHVTGLVLRQDLGECHKAQAGLDLGAGATTPGVPFMRLKLPLNPHQGWELGNNLSLDIHAT